jgi:hypothetical protein
MGSAERCAGLGAEVGLARQESPVRGRQHLGLALVLVHEMPHTLAALTRGEISEWRATLIARETAVLSREHRAQVDAELADKLAGAGDRKVADLARAIGYRLDPGSALRRVRGALADRRVGLRPAPETMANLTALLPVAQGVACKTALEKDADAKRAAGDPRTRGQIMADTLVARITGNPTDTVPEVPPVAVRLVMTDRTLLAGDTEPAHLLGYGTVPAAWARDRLAARVAVTRACAAAIPDFSCSSAPRWSTSSASVRPAPSCVARRESASRRSASDGATLSAAPGVPASPEPENMATVYRTCVRRCNPISRSDRARRAVVPRSASDRLASTIRGCTDTKTAPADRRE